MRKREVQRERDEIALYNIGSTSRPMNSLLYCNRSNAIYFEHNAQEEHERFQLKKIYKPNIVFKSNTENCNEYFMCVS